MNLKIGQTIYILVRDYSDKTLVGVFKMAVLEKNGETIPTKLYVHEGQVISCDDDIVCALMTDGFHGKSIGFIKIECVFETQEEALAIINSVNEYVDLDKEKPIAPNQPPDIHKLGNAGDVFGSLFGGIV